MNEIILKDNHNGSRLIIVTQAEEAVFEDGVLWITKAKQVIVLQVQAVARKSVMPCSWSQEFLANDRTCTAQVFTGNNSAHLSFVMGDEVRSIIPATNWFRSSLRYLLRDEVVFNRLLTRVPPEAIAALSI